MAEMMKFFGKATDEQKAMMTTLLEVDNNEPAAWEFLQQVTNTKLEPMDSQSTMGQEPIVEQPLVEQPLDTPEIIE